MGEADAQDVVEPALLTQTEQDILRILREEMDVAVNPVVQDGIFTLHLVMGKTVLEVLDTYADYYITPAMGGQRWRRGWRLISLDEEDWLQLTDDIYKKDLLE